MRGIGEGKENLSEEGGNTPTALLPLPNPASAARIPPSSSPKPFVFIEFPMVVLPVEEESAFPVFVRERRFLLAWIVFPSNVAFFHRESIR